MVTNTNSTSGISIDRTEVWTLELHIAPREGTMEVLLFNAKQDGSLTTTTIALDSNAESTLKAVEGAVYDNQLLLSDFKEVRVIIDSEKFVMLPQGFADDDAATSDGRSSAQAVMEAAFTSIDGDCAHCELPRCKAGIAFEASKGLIAFLRRTFFQPKIVHRLHPLCEHFARINSQSESSRMTLNFASSGEVMDVVAFSRGSLVLANTFRFHSPDDAAFYALHCWQQLGFNAKHDEILITGNRDLRQEVTQRLRQYVSYVMPAIFPAAALRLGNNAVKAPFELILLALCE